MKPGLHQHTSLRQDLRINPRLYQAMDLLHMPLLDQVRMLDLTPRQRLLADEFLGNVAEDGYLGATLEDIVRGANQLLEEYAVESEQEVTVLPYTMAEADEMLHIVQRLDPPGVA